ncbi:putative nuclease HARBI1 [Pseudophryne corroboree]|uniref:putative nuclease HARBI1 n=1 Tax=Pseudophryne corroboree TaxID=495146 RepID=UPI00308206D5
MVVCGPSLQILSLNAKYPVSAHDSHVIRQSGIWQRLRMMEGQDMWLLGDQGYPCTPWLMTPPPGPQSEFNSALTATRQLVERTIGILKGRFCVLHRTGGNLMYSPEMISLHITGRSPIWRNTLAHPLVRNRRPQPTAVPATRGQKAATLHTHWAPDQSPCSKEGARLEEARTRTEKERTNG